jgi:hypothetical protein
MNNIRSDWSNYAASSYQMGVIVMNRITATILIFQEKKVGLKNHVLFTNYL